MKIIHTKAIAILGMILSLATLYFLARGLVYTIARDVLYQEGAAFFSGISAILASSFSMLFYGVDGILCAIKAFKRIQPRLNTALAVMTLVGFVYVLIVVLNPFRTATIVVWYVLYFAIFVMELISFIRHLKDDTDII